MGGLEFANPGAFRLLLLLPVWLALVWPWSGNAVLFARGESARPHAGRFGLRGAVLLILPRVLRTAAIVAVVFALARPQRVEVVEESSLVGKGMALVVDLSSSMLAADMDDGRSRIAVAREAATRFAARRTRDELSLIAFARDALTRVPPTTDPAAVIAGVESLEVELVGDGTDISGAVLAAVGRLLESDREPRVVILLTDGAHNGTGIRPLAAARAAAALDVRVHAISVLPPEDSSRVATRRLYGDGYDPRAEMETVLGGIARLTGGEYFHAGTAADLDSIYGVIDRLEAPVEMVERSERREPLHTWFVLAALAMLGVDALVRGSRWGVIP